MLPVQALLCLNRLNGLWVQSGVKPPNQTVTCISVALSPRKVSRYFRK